NAEVFIHRSRPLRSILKAMNVMSKNHVSQNLFRELNRIEPFATFMARQGFPTTAWRIRNGSGLPVMGESRLDNQATCEAVIQVISKLGPSLARHSLKVSDILAVNGGDLGTMRERFEEQPETHHAVFSKTGSLK